MQKVKTVMAQIKSNQYILYYVLTGGLAIGLYEHAKAHMIVQDAWVWIIKSNVTFNFILFYFLWGLASDKFTKHLPKWQGWLIFGIGALVISLIFRFAGGMDTIFDK